MSYKQNAYRWVITNAINAPFFSWTLDRRVLADARMMLPASMLPEEPTRVPDDTASLCFPNWDVLMSQQSFHDFRCQPVWSHSGVEESAPLTDSQPCLLVLFSPAAGAEIHRYKERDLLSGIGSLDHEVEKSHNLLCERRRLRKASGLVHRPESQRAGRVDFSLNLKVWGWEKTDVPAQLIRWRVNSSFLSVVALFRPSEDWMIPSLILRRATCFP